MNDDDKRSSNKEVHLVKPSSKTDQLGVGGRHKQSQPSFEVGGYLDICNISDFDFLASTRKSDPRIKALHDMYVGEEWIQFAEIVGYESFMVLWMKFGEENNSKCLYVPTLSKYVRYQRNLLILKLFDEGYRSNQIKKHIKRELCEDISIRHIDRICLKSKMKR